MSNSSGRFLFATGDALTFQDQLNGIVSDIVGTVNLEFVGVVTASDHTPATDRFFGVPNLVNGLFVSGVFTLPTSGQSFINSLNTGEMLVGHQAGQNLRTYFRITAIDTAARTKLAAVSIAVILE